MSTSATLGPLLDGLTRDRRAHSVEVGRKVQGVSHLVDADVRHAAIDAAYLHDIGYAHPDSGFHPLDGARYLARLGYPATVCQLVAHHSGCVVEGRLRGIQPSELAPYRITTPAVETALKVLTWADMTTGPTGETVTLDERLEEVGRRYGSGHLVVAALAEARPILEEACQFVAGSMNGNV